VICSWHGVYELFAEVIGSRDGTCVSRYGGGANGELVRKWPIGLSELTKIREVLTKIGKSEYYQ